MFYLNSCIKWCYGYDNNEKHKGKRYTIEAELHKALRVMKCARGADEERTREKKRPSPQAAGGWWGGEEG